MRRSGSSAQSSAVPRQAKPYNRPAAAKAKEEQRCKCSSCLDEDPLGLPTDARTILRHQKNDRRMRQLASSSQSTIQAIAQVQPRLPSPSLPDVLESFPLPLLDDGSCGDCMDVDIPVILPQIRRAIVEEVPDEQLSYRGAEPLPFECGVLLISLDAWRLDDVSAKGHPSTVLQPRCSETPDSQLQTGTVLSSEQVVDFPDVLPFTLPAVHTTHDAEAPTSATSAGAPQAQGPVINPDARTRGRAFHSAEDFASLKLPREPPRTHPLPPAPNLPPFKAALDDAYAASHEKWYIRSFFALGAVLHYKYHVSHVAVNLLMWTVCTVFTALGLLLPVPGRPNLHKFTQTRTVLKRLSLDDAVTVYPTCPKCHYIAPPDSPRGALCLECSEPLFGARSLLGALRGAKPVPVRPWGYIPLSYLLSVKLSDDELQQEIEAETSRKRRTGEYHDMLDGAVMRDLRGHDGKLFFGDHDDEELRIGVTMNGDGFAPFFSTFRDNHSTTAISFSIANLNIALRYAHLLVPTLIPGPKEPTCQQLQRYLALVVDDLIMLFEHGVLVYSKKYPNGRRVRVALIAVVCDHPAMCRTCGFADKNHKVAPCTKCKIGQEQISTLAGVTQVYKARSGAEQKKLALDWIELPADKRDAHYALHGQQWFELARLPYFDPVRQTVVGPMHCLLNGLMKNLWYETWIKGRKALRAGTEAGTLRELDFIHKLLNTFEAAPWVGRLPKLVGEPAGGSLSADEWKHMGTTFGPIVIPPLWYQTQSAADAEHAGATARYKKKVVDHGKAQEKFTLALARRPAASASTASASTSAQATLPTPADQGTRRKTKKGAAPAVPEPTTLEEWLERNPVPRPPVGLRRVEAEVPMFLSLSAALRVLLSRSLAADDVRRGDSLMLEHLRRFAEVYGDTYIKYNQHWATHVPPQIPDFGPVYGFWEFPGERINKTLKNINTNNRRAGELELTMLRSYNKTTRLMHMLSAAERKCADPVEKSILSRLSTDGRQVRGTVDAVIASHSEHDAAEVEEADDHGIARDDELVGERNFISVGPPAQPAYLSAREQQSLICHYRASGFQVHAAFDARQHAQGSTALSVYAQPHAFLILDGRRIHSASSNGASASALVKLRHRSSDANLRSEHGEVLNIFTHSHLSMQRTFATVRTFKACNAGLLHDGWGSWSTYPEVEVEYWHVDRYKEFKVVAIEDIVCQVARARYEDPDLWMTVSLERHRVRR